VDDKDSLAGLGRWVTQLRVDRGMNKKELAAALHVTPAVVTRVETGETVSEEVADDLDDFFDADGEIIAWRRRAVTRGRPRKKGVSPTNRRDLLCCVGTPVAVEALDRAEQASRAITAACPDPWTLAELAEDSTTIAAGYWSTPLEDLLPEVLGRWRRLADMLDRGPIGTVGVQVVNLAGQYAFYVARIGRHTGDRRLAAGFGTLAEQYAAASDDPLLVGSVACMRSRMAFDGARFAEAAAIAGRAAGQAHPYTRARLFAYQAHALAAGGHPDQARDALADMRAHVVDLPRMPGAGLFSERDQLGFSAMALVEIGDHQEAEAFAREELAGTPTNLYESRGIAWLTIGQALAGRDPGAAADAGLQALASARSWPSAYIDRHVRRLHRDLSRHGKVAEVAQLGAACEAARSAL
jgi:transcriptional regulator with XRE-family HTH domain